MHYTMSVYTQNIMKHLTFSCSNICLFLRCASDDGCLKWLSGWAVRSRLPRDWVWGLRCRIADAQALEFEDIELLEAFGNLGYMALP